MTSEQTAETIPVLYNLDDNGEANGGHFFCCVGCRSQSPHKHTERINEGEACRSHVLDGTQCETCGGPVEIPFSRHR